MRRSHLWDDPPMHCVESFLLLFWRKRDMFQSIISTYCALFILRLYLLGWPTFQTVFVSSLKRYKVTANSIKEFKICEMIRNYIKVDKDVAARQLEAA